MERTEEENKRAFDFHLWLNALRAEGTSTDKEIALAMINTPYPKEYHDLIWEFVNKVGQTQ